MGSSTAEYDDLCIASVFEERAEHLSRSDLLRWTSDFSRDKAILSKLKGQGLKLLIGPRGSGKSTQLMRAFYSMLEGKSTLPAYINFSKSLSLEPLFHSKANAIEIFRQWIVSNIICNSLA